MPSFSLKMENKHAISRDILGQKPYQLFHLNILINGEENIPVVLSCIENTTDTLLYKATI